MEKKTISQKTLAKTAVACAAALVSLGALQIGEYSLPAAETETKSAETETASAAETGATAEAETSAGTEADGEETDASAEAETDAGTEADGEETDAAEAETGGYTPGTYTASAKGISSDVTAVCTFDETGLTAVSLDVSGETPDIGGAIGDEMSAAILSAQSADVDAVSGATVTSTAVTDAVADCFSQAKSAEAAAEPASESETEETKETETVEAETETQAETLEMATEIAEVAAVGTDETAESETEVLETASETETETEDEAAAAKAGVYTAGTYTASAKGLESDVTVFCTFDETGLTAISLDVSGETPDIGGAIGDEMSASILNAQSCDVDGVSGATITSTAVLEAVQSCFDQAAGSSEETASEEESENAQEEETQEASAATGKYTPGTYTASATGMESIVNAFCTFGENSLVAIGLDISGAESDFIDPVRDEMTDAILEAQSAEVDTVSGATVTSDAVIEAVQSCFDQAAGIKAAD